MAKVVFFIYTHRIGDILNFHGRVFGIDESKLPSFLFSLHLVLAFLFRGALLFVAVRAVVRRAEQSAL